MNTFKSYRIFSTLVCLALMLVLTIGSVNAIPTQQNETDFAAMDAYLTEQMNNLNIPGMALGIVQNGQITHLRGFGVADSSGRAVTPQTPFFIASLTKSFTALAVMQLVEAGKINLDAPVQTYLPWFELADKDASARITVRNLLNHTSGISTEDGDPDWTSQQGLEATLRELDSLQLAQPVGTSYQYSNINFNIAGLIVEQVSGQPYADYVTQNIFEPLDMRHSYADRSSALADGLAEGYSYMFGQTYVVEDLLPPVNLPAGGLIVSVEDMAHYALAQLNEGRYGDTAVLSPQGIAELHTPAISSGGDRYYAMGWETGILDGTPFIGHGGALRNFRGQIFLLPEKDWAVILLANTHGFEQLMQVPDIAINVISMLNGKSTPPVSLIFKVRFLYWAVLLMPLLMILGIAFSLRYPRRKGLRHLILVVVLYGGFGLLWLLGVPQLMGPPASSGNRIFYPEVAYGWVAGVILGIGWSVIYTVINRMAKRSG